MGHQQHRDALLKKWRLKHTWLRYNNEFAWCHCCTTFTQFRGRDFLSMKIQDIHKLTAWILAEHSQKRTHVTCLDAMGGSQPKELT